MKVVSPIGPDALRPPAAAATERAPADEPTFQITISHQVDQLNSAAETVSAGCGGCFYCDQEMPACCEGVIGGAEPPALQRRRRRPGAGPRPVFGDVPRAVTARWARRAARTTSTPTL